MNDTIACSMSRIRAQVSGLEQRRLLSAGDPDWSFGDHGSVAIGADVAFEFSGPAIIPLAGGDMLLTGRTAVRRVDAAGAIDFTFGKVSPRDTKGFLSPTGIPETDGWIEVRDVDAMDDGRFVVVTGGTISRYDGDGTPDVSFGLGGSLAVADLLTPLADVYLAAVRPDGRIIVEGVTPAGLVTISGLTPSGDIDPTFTAFTFHGNTSPARFGALSIQDDGKILLAADGDTNGRSFRMIRFDSDGAVDSTFADRGVYPVAGEVDRIGLVQDFAVDDQDRIVTIESIAGGVMAVRRLLSNGSVDTTFGGGGGGAADADHRTRVNFAYARGDARLELDGNGRILVQDDHRLARLTEDGLLDPSFGNVTTAGDIDMRGLRPFDDGSLYVAGFGSEIEGDPPVGSIARLYRLRADATPPAMAVDSSATLAIVGTDQADRISVFSSGPADLVAHVLNKAAEARGSFGRVFDRADVSLISVSAGDGDDFVSLSLAPRPATVSAGDGDDQIIGSPAGDSLSGNAGSDRIDGRGGDDRLDGNGGRDKLRGEDGNDRLFGGNAGDWLSGGDGDDILLGQLGDDYLDGNAGSDRVMGSDGNDRFVSDDGAFDDLYGGGGADVLSGHDGEDRLTDIETT